MWQSFLILAFLVLLMAAFAVLWRSLFLKTSSLRRWYKVTNDDVAKRGNDPLAFEPALESQGFMGRWIYRAGFRQPHATATFIAVTISAVVLGLMLALAMTLSGLQAAMERSIVVVPGGVGETFLPIVWVGPWLLMLTIGLAPWLIVRRARRERVMLIEQDLPLALELLSTLSEAGLGFDAALTRILKTRLGGRPLADEFRVFQADLLAGRPRTESLRRLSYRLDISSISIFVSALVQAEQLGMGIARVLRQQADDVRSRRRERAIAFANSLAVKRVIPLVVCFLPGLFVWTLGPAFVQLFKMAETFVQVRNL